MLLVRDPLHKLRRSFRRYRREEDGSLIVFSLFIFFAMILFGGIAVDLMLYENRRTHIQNSTDRAVLAAANLKQSLLPREVVKDYLGKVGVQVSDDDIDVYEIGAQPVVTGRQVAVDVTGSFDTLLMHLVGVESLPYNAFSEAAESVNDIEVSLVLDVSGSMGQGTKLANLKSAAKDFVEKILAGAEDDRVSVSLVPYSTQVSAGPALLPLMNTTHGHGYSHCVNFDALDFRTTAINHNRPLSQTAHFDPWTNYRGGQGVSSPVCRNESYFDITPWSNDATALTGQIDAFVAGGNTSIDIAVKWAAALLDPSMNVPLNGLIANGTVDGAFSNRPHAYDYEDSLKFIVVMTDGINTSQYYLKDQYKTGASPLFRDTATGDYSVQSRESGDRDGDGRRNEPWYHVNDRRWSSEAYDSDGAGTGSAAVQVDWLDLWADMTMSWRAYNVFYRQSFSADDYYDNLYGPREVVTDTEKDTRLAEICGAAKAQGVVVFAIGFEVTDHSAGVMRNCASTPQHFYRVEGLDIEYAFASIANQINQLKLTQ